MRPTDFGFPMIERLNRAQVSGHSSSPARRYPQPHVRLKEAYEARDSEPQMTF